MKKGFSLIEVIVIITIIAALAGLTAPLIVRQQAAYEETEKYRETLQPAVDPQRKIADQLERQNNLLERQLKMQEAALPAERQ